VRLEASGNREVLMGSTWGEISACGEARDKCKNKANAVGAAAAVGVGLAILAGPIGWLGLAGAGVAGFGVGAQVGEAHNGCDDDFKKCVEDA
jgi:hypothetical protein